MGIMGTATSSMSAVTVCNLPSGTSEVHLADYFGRFGRIMVYSCSLPSFAYTLIQSLYVRAELVEEGNSVIRCRVPHLVALVSDARTCKMLFTER